MRPSAQISNTKSLQHLSENVMPITLSRQLHILLIMLQQPPVDSTVTRLLVAIKQLLESFQLWSTGAMSDVDVSNVYVQLGNEFNSAVAAFNAYHIDMRYA